MAGDIESLLTELSAARVRYLVVGGVAVVLHGYGRATLDLDLAINLDAENVERALRVLARRGFRPCQPVPRKTSSSFRRNPPFEIDIVVDLPFPFEDAYQRAMTVPISESIISVAAIDDIIVMKRLAGRAQDARDIEVLLQLKEPEPEEICDAPFDGSFEGTSRRQALLGRKIAPQERLRWFERHMAELRSLLGRAS